MMALRDVFPLFCLLCVGFTVLPASCSNWEWIHGHNHLLNANFSEPIPPFSMDEYNKTTFDRCIVYDNKTDKLSIFSTSECLDPIVALMKPNTTDFLVGKDRPRNISLAFKTNLLIGGRRNSTVRYTFGECSLIFYRDSDDTRCFDCGQVHDEQSPHDPFTPNENKTHVSTMIGPQGVTLNGDKQYILSRDCKVFNPDGTINFTQTVLSGVPSWRFRFINLDNKTDFQRVFVEPKTGEVLSPPTTTAKPESGALSILYIVLIVAGSLLAVLLVVGLIGFCVWKKSKAAKAAALAKAEKTQTASTMGTVSTQGTTAGTTVGGEEQINVIVQT